MPELDSSGSSLGKKKKSASPGSNRANGPQKHGIARESKVDKSGASSPAPVSRLERTRRLLHAALRVWELKRRIRD